MWGYVLRRLLWLPFLIIGATGIVFLVVNLTPGDPIRIMFGANVENIPPQTIQEIRQRWGLDKPLIVRYSNYLWRLVQGDLGDSITAKRPVAALLAERLPNTAQLGLASLLIAVVIGVSAGIVSAVQRYSVKDYVVTFLAFVGVSTPNFWLGLMLMWFFGLKLRWLPIFGMGHAGFWDSLRHLILPAMTLGTGMTASLARLTRAAMIEVLAEDYIKTARSKGVSERTVVYRHALRNAALSVVTMLGLQAAGLLGGAVIVETMFAWPGVGRLIVDAIWKRDFFVIMGGVLMLTGVYVVVNLVVDLAYGVLDPRIKYE